MLRRLLVGTTALACLGVVAADEGHYIAGSYPFFGGVEPATRVGCGLGPEGEDVGGVCIPVASGTTSLRVEVHDEVWESSIALYAIGYDAQDAPCNDSTTGIGVVYVAVASTCATIEVSADVSATEGWMSWS